MESDMQAKVLLGHCWPQPLGPSASGPFLEMPGREQAGEGERQGQGPVHPTPEL